MSPGPRLRACGAASSGSASSRPGRAAFRSRSRDGKRSASARTTLDAAPAGRSAAADGRLRARQPDLVVMWRSFHRRLGDRYRVVAVDQVSMGLSADRCRDASRSGWTTSAGFSTRSRSRAGRARGARLGRSDRARLGAGAPGARARDPALQHRRRAAATGVPCRSGSRARAAARPRLPANLGVRPRHARHRPRADRRGGRRAATSALPNAQDGGRSPSSSRISPRLPPTRPTVPSAGSLRDWRRSTFRCCSRGASATRCSTSVRRRSPSPDASGGATPLPARRSPRRRGGGRRFGGGRVDRAGLESPGRAPGAPRSRRAPWSALVPREDDEATAVAVGRGGTNSFASLALRVAELA